MNSKIIPSFIEDAPELGELVNSAYRGAYSKQGWTSEADLLDGTRIDAKAIEEIIQKPNTVILKYTENGKIIGCMELQSQQDNLYLGMLTVEPMLQGKGVGKELLVAAEDYARENDCRSIRMTVISVRTELVAWYVRHGYRDTGKRQPFHFSDPRFGIPKQDLEFVVLEKIIEGR